MKKRTGGIFATLILLVIFVFLAVEVGYSLYAPARLDASLPVCILNTISGDTMVQERDTMAWVKAEDGMILEPGSRIMTASDAHASITFLSGTTTKLEPGTDIIITALEVHRGGSSTYKLEQRSGSTWNVVAAMTEDGVFEIATAAADITVHGTMFATSVDENGKTTVQTTEGSVAVSAQGEEVIVGTGMQTEVEPGSVPEEPSTMPPAVSELVFTISETVMGMVVDPSGSRTGYLPDGTTVNQISGSSLATAEGGQAIHVPEPEDGNYAVVMHGKEDGEGFFSIEGFNSGISTFFHSGSCNMTSVNDLVLDLHMDVIDGFLQGATVLGLRSADNQPIIVQTTLKSEASRSIMDNRQNRLGEIEKEGPAAPVKEEYLERIISWLRLGETSIYQQAVMAAIVVFMAVISIIIWRRR